MRGLEKYEWNKENLRKLFEKKLNQKRNFILLRKNRLNSFDLGQIRPAPKVWGIN